MLALFSPNAMTEKIVWRRVPEDEDHPVWTACIIRWTPTLDALGHNRAVHNPSERLHWTHLVTTVQCLTCLNVYIGCTWSQPCSAYPVWTSTLDALGHNRAVLNPFERLHWMHLVTTVQCIIRLNVFTGRTWSQPCSALPVYTSSLDTFGHPVCVTLGSLPVLGPIRAVLSPWLPSTPICVW